jgi:predicted Zn-dependent protease
MRIRHRQDYGAQGLGMSFKIPDDIDKYIGDAGEESAVAEFGGVYKNPAATAYVEKIGQALVKNSKRKDFGYKFGIVNSEIPNAFALPNGSLYITVGLLRLLKDEAQLANVMGHEVAHVTQRHTIKQLQVNLGATAFASLLGLFLRGEGKDEAKEMVSGLISNGYSRENESDADAVGQGLAAKALWDPKGMVGVMQIFQSLEKKKPEGIEEYMRSHPYSGDRVVAATERLPSFPAPTQGWVAGDDSYKNFFTDVLKAPAAPQSSVARFAPAGLSPYGNFDPSGDFGKIAGVALISLSALALIYFAFIRKDD